MGTSLGLKKAWINRRLNGTDKPWNKGKPRTEIEKENISKAIRQAYSKPETRRGGNRQPRTEEEKAYLREINNGTGNGFYGKKHSEETRRIMSIKASHPRPYLCGEKNGQYGRRWHHAEEAKEKIRQHQLEIWQNPEYRDRVIAASMRARSMSPNGIETEVIQVIEKHGLPYKYTGDGSFLVGGLNPDFVNVNGEKIALEIFGDYWHRHAKRIPQTEQGRYAIFRDYGWKLIIIWESELREQGIENVILRRLNIHCLI